VLRRWRERGEGSIWIERGQTGGSVSMIVMILTRYYDSNERAKEEEEGGAHLQESVHFLLIQALPLAVVVEQRLYPIDLIIALFTLLG
jgi:hypothetical protein